MVYECIRKCRVEEHKCAAGLQDAEMRGDNLPVVLRYGDGDDLVWAIKILGHGRGNVFSPRVKLRIGKRLTCMGNLERNVIGVSRGGAAEDLRQPSHASLMRDIDECALPKSVRKTIGALVWQLTRTLLTRPKIPSPSQINDEQKQR